LVFSNKIPVFNHLTELIDAVIDKIFLDSI